MIEEIKNTRTTFGAFDATSYQKDKWIRFLLSEVERKDTELKQLQESYQVTNNDYKALTNIIDRARKLAYLSGEGEAK